jgi:uncharacterized protein (DUF362 family)
MSMLDNVGLAFEESMSGYLGVGEHDPGEGAGVGRRRDSPIRIDVKIAISDLGRFLKVSQHEAALSGTVTCEALGGTYEIRDGTFNLFVTDPSTGMGQMRYAFRFTDRHGQVYYLRGHKEIRDDPHALDMLDDLTRLLVVIHQGQDAQGPIYGAGEMRFKLADAPGLVTSMKVTNTRSPWQQVAARLAFAHFAYGALRQEYLKNVTLLYETRYENLVLSGTVRDAGEQRPFFLVSGVHDKGFPWGDGETFWDVLLAVGDGSGGYHRYAVTDRVLEGLEVDVERGICRYEGPLYAIRTGYGTSFSHIRSASPELEPCLARMEIEFDARPQDTVPFPFPVIGRFLRKLAGPLARQLREAIPTHCELGIYITPHTVQVRSGKFSISAVSAAGEPAGARKELEIVADRTFGEAEVSTFRSLREPTLLYGYICAVRPDAQAARVQIHSRTLRDRRERWARDQLNAFLGTVVSRVASAEILMEDGRFACRRFNRSDYDPRGRQLFRKLGEPVIEVKNDHYPTAVFLRRIVRVQDPSGRECLALEEDMSLMRLEAVTSDRKVTVAAVKEDDKFDALEKALAETGFDKLLEQRRAASNKPRADYLIVIKPNFMFAYDRNDRSTYTDPELVGHLAVHLRDLGYENVAVVEAQSTYGEYFDRRSVREMAEYLGFDGKAGYRVVDMTDDASERRQFGPHLGLHPVSTVWRDADFRISFAKNKTHAYAYYTLTLKNIYGALPLANKFQEYHCRRDIYHTAIEYLTAFPVHFGLVDAYLSADGPFGIFADTCPNATRTIIAGQDLVAVDWVAASKMGIDPMISQYMQLAVEAFGKPEIHLVGDAGVYQPWLNVPVALTLFTHKGLDADYYFGNLFYTSCAQMDESHFTHKSRSLPIRMLRRLTVPLRRTFFVRTGERPTWANRLASALFYRLGF